MAVIKVNPWGKGQGDHVLIDEKDFNPEIHVKFGEAKKKGPAKKPDAKEVN